MVITRMSLIRPFFRSLAASALLLAAGALDAEVTWSPETGWRVEGGILSDLASADGRNALELMNQARSAEEAGNQGKALDAYEKVVKKYPSSVFAADAYYRIAGIRHARHEYFKAFDAYQQIISRYPNTEKFNDVVGRQYRIASELSEGARNRLWGILPGFKNRDRAVAYFEATVANAPYSDYAPLSLMNVARAHQRMGNTEEAIDALDRMINFYPRSVLTPDAYLRLAQTHASLVEGAYYDQASTKEAITYFEDFLILFPGDTGAANAEKGLADMKKVLAESKMILADYYFKYRKNYKAAKVFYNEAITVFPDSEVAARARSQLAQVDARIEAASAGQPAPVTAPDAAPSPGKVTPKKKRFLLF